MAKSLGQIKDEWNIIKNETIEDANTATRVGGAGVDIVDYFAASVDVLAVTKAEKSVVDALQNGIIKQPAVDTYNTDSNSLASVYGLTVNNNGSNGKVKQNGWDVLVLDDETKGGKSNRYNWNGSIWVDMETGIYDESVALSGGLDKTLKEVNDSLIQLESDKIGQWTAKAYTAGQMVLEDGRMWEAVVNTTVAQRPGVVAETIWKRILKVNIPKLTPILTEGDVKRIDNNTLFIAKKSSPTDLPVTDITAFNKVRTSPRGVINVEGYFGKL